jgi:hypothetical protein
MVAPRALVRDRLRAAFNCRIAKPSLGGFRAGRTLPLNHRYNLEDKADPEIVAANSRLGAGKTHHSKAGSAADRCLSGRQ